MEDGEPKQERLGDRARDWWRNLQGNTADRAALRRCVGTRDAIFVPSTLTLMQRLGWKRNDDSGRDFIAERCAVIALVLASVREDRPGISVARQIGVQGDRPVLNETKFRVLLGAEDPDEILAEMMTLVRLAGWAVNVGDLAESIYWWGHPSGRTQRRWLYDYHGIFEAAVTSVAEDQ